MRKGMVIQIVLIAFVLQLLAGITLYAASNGAVTMTNVTNGTILSVVKTKSGLVFSDSLNKTLTQQQLFPTTPIGSTTARLGTRRHPTPSLRTRRACR